MPIAANTANRKCKKVYAEDIKLCQGMAVYTPKGGMGGIQTADVDGTCPPHVTVANRGSNIWEGHPSQLSIVGPPDMYFFPAIFGPEDDVRIARKKMAMIGHKQDKQEAQKATPPAIPDHWDPAEGLRYAKDVTTSFHGYLEGAQSASLTDKGYIQAWYQSIQACKKVPWENNSEILATLNTAASNRWTFQETLYKKL